MHIQHSTLQYSTVSTAESGQLKSSQIDRVECSVTGLISVITDRFSRDVLTSFGRSARMPSIMADRMRPIVPLSTRSGSITSHIYPRAWW